MAEAPFEKVAIRAIIKKAGVPTGSFYARFPTKQALLTFLYERYITDMEATAERELPAMKRLPPRQSLAAIVRLACRLYKKRRGVVRSAYLHFRTGAPQVAILDTMAGRHARLVGKLQAVITHAAQRRRHPDPQRAARFILKIILVAGREHFLFPEQASAIVMTDTEFESELIRTADAYLRARSN